MFVNLRINFFITTFTYDFYLGERIDKIIFISNWVKKKFVENLPKLSDNKTKIIYHSIDEIKKNIKKNKQIIFVGKLNESKGYDLYCKSMFKILNENKDWKAYSIGEEKRFQNKESVKNEP